MLKLKYIKLILIIIPFFFLIIGFYGCGDTTTTPQADNLSVSYMSNADTTDNVSILQLDTVKILIENIKLNVSGNSDTTNFKVGPYVFYLNLSASINTVATAYIPAGTYDKVIFDIHKLDDNETPPDPDFVDSSGRYAVVVKGRFNGIAFVFKSDKSVHQKLNFPNSLIVTSTGLSNITIVARPYIWFYDNGVLLDPNNPSNKSIIENNIKDNVNNNFKAFKDNDKNGVPDN